MAMQVSHEWRAAQFSPSRDDCPDVVLDVSHQDAPCPRTLQLLTGHLLAALEHFFGASLSGLQISLSHVPKAFGAPAFAFGNRVVLCPEYGDLRQTRSMALLLHEVTHVIQQRRGDHLHIAVRGAVLHGIDLEHEAERNERCADEVIALWKACECAGIWTNPKSDQTEVLRPVIQLSQGLELELGGIAIGRSKKDRKGIKPRSLDYGQKLFTTRNAPHGLDDDLPRLYAEVDNRRYSMPELVTQPIMSRQVVDTPIFRLMLRDAEFIAGEIRQFIAEQRPGKHKRSLLEFLAHYNRAVEEKNLQQTSPDEGYPYVRLLRQSTSGLPLDRVFIGIQESIKAMERNIDRHKDEDWAIEVMVHHNASVPIERVGYKDFCNVAEEQMVHEIYGKRKQHRRLWRLAIAAGHCIVYKHFRAEDPDDQRKLRKLVGLFGVICYAISTMAKTREFMDAGGIYKNKFALLPRNSMCDLMSHGLSSRAQDILGSALDDAGTRTEVYQSIQRACGIDSLDRSFDQEYKSFVFTPSIFLEAAFSGLARVDGSFGFEPVEDIEVRRTASVFSNIVDPEANEDDPPAQHERHVRNVVFEQRLAGKFPYVGLAEGIAPANASDAHLWDFAFSMDDLYRDWKQGNEDEQELAFTSYQVPHDWIAEFVVERGWPEEDTPPGPSADQ